MVERIKRRHVRPITEHDGFVAGLPVPVPQPAVGRRAAEQSDPAAEKRVAVAAEVVIDAEARRPQHVAAGQPPGVGAEGGGHQPLVRHGRVEQEGDVEAQPAGEREARGRRPPVLCVEAEPEHAEVGSRRSRRAPKPPVVVVRESPREQVETAKEPSSGRHLHQGVAEVKQLAVRADGHEVWPGADGEVLRDLDDGLTNIGCRAHTVGPGHQRSGIGGDLDQRKRGVGPAGVPQALVAHNELVLRAAAHDRAPDQARRLGCGQAPTCDRGEGVRAVRPTGIDELAAVGMGVVLR